jgi:Tudor domain
MLSVTTHSQRNSTSHIDLGGTAPVKDKPKMNMAEDRLPNTVSYLSRNTMSAESNKSTMLSRQSSRNSVGSSGADDSESRRLERTTSNSSTKSATVSGSERNHCTYDTTGSGSGHQTTRRSNSQEESHSALLNFVNEKITFGRWLGCVVSHVDDPENFYCQLEGDNNVELLESLMARVEKYVHSLPPGIGLLRSAALGQPVIAKYSADGCWYRARVTGTDSTVIYNYCSVISVCRV